jgi:hypothetical protein
MKPPDRSGLLVSDRIQARVRLGGYQTPAHCADRMPVTEHVRVETLKGKPEHAGRGTSGQCA